MDKTIPDRGPAVLAVTTATLALASILVGVRIISRHFVIRKVTWDDKVMVVAWLIAFFLSFTINLGVANGLGKPDKYISHDEWITIRRCEYVFSILYNPALAATKTSILVLYLRLARTTQVVLRCASLVTLVIVNVAGAVLTIMNIFQCSPIRASWTMDADEGAICIPLLTEFICSAPVNILTDLAILALPIPIVTRLNLPTRQTMILVSTFALGIFVTIVDVVRIYYLQEAIGDRSESLPGPGPEFGAPSGFAWNASLSIMWSAVEVNVGIACASVPMMKPLVVKLLPHILEGPGIQGVGGITGGLLAQKLFFRGLDQDAVANSRTLINVQWTYLGITLLCVLLGLVFSHLPLPEVSDLELEKSMTRLPVNPKKASKLGLQLRTASLILAVFAQYTYVGLQEANIAYFRNLLVSTPHPSRDTSNSERPPGFAS
ncbi:ferric-chelate reductase [Purpureocillium lavendulum]|uniref:Ferric-chelate reductase n=1 Tax=Purpureocillium lavendulum TaxID=1247861 RepID=A0AB34FCM8_9HYPO|nr:ferric-chelate reductase [Purpureocillium lavendulum]